jgi:hypothetical protein
LQIPGITKSLRENDIKSNFNDTSLNGVDHWINVGKYHVLIQDKWKETTSQPEVAQFLQCAKRISDKIPRSEDILKIWASKTEPTSNSRKILEEENVTIIVSDYSLEDLANKVIHRVYKYFGKDIHYLFENEIDQEAREVLKIRNELQQKKELEEKKRIEDEEREAREILKIRNELQKKKEIEEKKRIEDNEKLELLLKNSYNCEILSMYTQVRLYSNWNSNNFNIIGTPDKLLKIYEDINKFSETITPQIKETIKEYMESVWGEITDKVCENYEINFARYNQNFWSSGLSFIIQKLSKGDNTELWFENTQPCFTNSTTPSKTWKSAVVTNISRPLLAEANQEWTKYCSRFNERAKRSGYLSAAELSKKNLELEEQVSKLKERNSILEEKYTKIKQLMSNL